MRQSIRLRVPRGPRLCLLATALLLGGCYSYVPVRLESVEPGQAIRLRVSAEEAERLAPARLTDSRLVDGVLVGAQGDRLLLDTTVGSADPLRGGRTFTQRLDVALGQIFEVELRQKDRLRTGLAVGAGAAAVGVGVAAALTGGFGVRRVDGENPEEDRRGPPITLRLRVPY